MSKRESKFLGGAITEVKQEDRKGVPVGIIEGYIATYDLDRGDYFGTKDQFKRGAFTESILDHMQKRRPVRLKDHHGRTVGAFPIEHVKEDERGLFGIGEINLEVQQGKELYALCKQGAISDFSIGFSVVDYDMDGDIRTINKATIWEGSAVDEPMNPHANITAVKNHEDDNVNYYNTEDVKDWGKRELENALREGAKFSKNASKAIISLSIWTDKDSEAEDEAAQKALDEQAAIDTDKKIDDILAELKGLKKTVAV